MPVNNLFDKPFDEGTISKLELFEHYLDSWLPIFTSSDFKKPIQVFDLFAGAGKDLNGVDGSPLRILRVIEKHSNLLRQKKKKVHLYLNDIDNNNISSLIDSCNKKLLEYSILDVVDLLITNTSFVDFLKLYKPQIDYGCNLIFVDQNGFREVSESVFKYLINIESSEFIFFISSSFLHRFAADPEVQKYHPKFNFEIIKKSDRKVVHNVVCREFDKYVPKNIDSYSLIPFSILKSDNNNVYGLIFVSKHIRGADKFLEVAWRMNSINGTANFDIDDDFKKDQYDIFKGKLLTKIETFHNNLEILILSKVLKTNLDVYVYTLNEGHIPKHAHKKLVSMKKANLIEYNGRSPLVKYDQIFNNHREIEFIVIEK